MMMGRPRLDDGAGLWIPGANGIHMMFMRFPMDAVFVGRPAADGSRTVIDVRASLPAWTGLVPLVRGDAVLTTALHDDGAAGGLPAATAHREGRTWILDGEKRLVPAAHLAKRMLVPARAENGVGLFLADPEAEGVTLSRRATSRGEPLFDVHFARVRVASEDLLGDHVASDTSVLEWIRQTFIFERR